MRTSIDVPDALLRRAKKVARARGVTLRALVIEGLGAVLETSRSAPRYRPKDCSFGGDGLVEGLSWTDADRIRELVYEGRGA